MFSGTNREKTTRGFELCTLDLREFSLDASGLFTSLSLFTLGPPVKVFSTVFFLFSFFLIASNNQMHAAATDIDLARADIDSGPPCCSCDQSQLPLQKYAGACCAADAALTSSSTLSNSLVGLCSLEPWWLQNGKGKLIAFVNPCGARVFPFPA